MSREAHPIEAAGRRQIFAPGASPGFFGQYGSSPALFVANFFPK
jgi:hypothetical protein